MSLNNQSACLADLGRREEALAAIEEAVGIYRQLAQARPDAFLPDLAMSLNNQSDLPGRPGAAGGGAGRDRGGRRHLPPARRGPPRRVPPRPRHVAEQPVASPGRPGRREEALAAVEEAVGIYRQLAQARPDAFLPDLAMSLNNQSICLGDLGRREEALAAIEEAVAIRRQLAQARPDAFLPDLATSLHNLANVLSMLNRDEEASAIREEANAAIGALARLSAEHAKDQANVQPSDP